MTQFALVALGALLLYLALRVVQMKRRSMPFLVAYPLFVIVFLGGGVGMFVGASRLVAELRLGQELAPAAVYGATALTLVILWLVARRLIA